MRILYVEDEKFLADAVIHVLDKNGISVEWADDGEKGLELALKPIYDVIVLDIMLPKMSGFDILRHIRERGVKTPVIMLSALSQAEDKVRGLDYGADDYLAKPFKTAELVARLRALARRPVLRDEKLLCFGDLYYDLENRSLNDIPLTEKEALLLETLLRNPDRAQNKEYLLNHIWGSESFSDGNYVEVYISYLRKKLAALHGNIQIKTSRNAGYSLEDVDD